MHLGISSGYFPILLYSCFCKTDKYVYLLKDLCRYASCHSYRMATNIAKPAEATTQRPYLLFVLFKNRSF